MPEITAHRAGAALGPENSLQALAQSIVFGTPWAEIDVQLTSDGTVVVFHDADLQRLAGDPRHVRALPYAELPLLAIGIPIPTLAEFIATARGRIRLNIELKELGDGTELVTRVVALLQAQGFLTQAAVCSFNPELVEQAKRAAPALTVGHVLHGEALPAHPADFVSVASAAINAPLVRAAHRRGMTVHAWTVDTRAEMLRLLALGVDNLITDDPALGMETLRAFAGLSFWRRAYLRWRA